MISSSPAKERKSAGGRWQLLEPQGRGGQLQQHRGYAEAKPLAKGDRASLHTTDAGDHQIGRSANLVALPPRVTPSIRAKKLGSRAWGTAPGSERSPAWRLLSSRTGVSVASSGMLGTSDEAAALLSSNHWGPAPLSLLISPLKPTAAEANTPCRSRPPISTNRPMK